MHLPFVRLLRSPGAALLVALAACATSPEKPDKPQVPADDGVATLAQMRQIRARVRRGEGPQVHRELDAQLQDHPGDRHLLFLETVAGMPSEAAWQSFKQMSTDAPGDPWPFIAMGDIYAEWKMFDQANATFDRVLKARPGFLPAELGKALVMQQSGDLVHAKPALKALVARADLPEIHQGLGLIAVGEGDLSTARSELEEALKGDAGGLDAQRAMANVALKQGDKDRAMLALEQVVAMDPKDGASHFQLGLLEEEKGQLAKAIEELRKAGAIRGMDLETAQHLLGIATKLGDKKVEERALEEVARLDRKGTGAPLKLARLALEAKSYSDAEQYFHEVLERDPALGDAVLGLARVYRETKRTREAIEALRALAAKPGAPDAVKEALGPMEAELKLSSKPVAGDVNRINVRFGADLNKFYRERLKQKPGLQGKLRLKVEVNPDGTVQGVTIQEDTLKDEPLALHAYFTMKDAQFPKARRSPVFEYELRP